jgi:hypothetical protein
VTVLDAVAFAARFPGERAPAAREGPVFGAALVSVANLDVLTEHLATSGVATGESSSGEPFVRAADAYGLVLGFVSPT